MAEAVRERTGGTKTKPKKSKSRSKTADKGQSVPPPDEEITGTTAPTSQDSQHEETSQPILLGEAPVSVGQVQCTEDSVLVRKRPEPSAIRNETRRGFIYDSTDLEVDGGEVTHTEDLAVQVADLLVLPKEEEEEEDIVSDAVSGPGEGASEPEASQQPDAVSSHPGAVELVDIPGPFHQEQDVHLEYEVDGDRPDDGLVARGSASVASPLPVNSLSADLLPVLEQSAGHVASAVTESVITNSENNAGMVGESAEVLSQMLSDPRNVQAQSESATHEPQVVEAVVSEVPSTCTMASAPAPSLEFQHPPPPSELAVSAEPVTSTPSALPVTATVTAPTFLPLQPQSTAPMEAIPPPTAPMEAIPLPTAPMEAIPPPTAPMEAIPSPTAPQAVDTVSPSVESRLPQSATSPMAHRTLYPRVPVMDSASEGRFQPMSDEQLQQLYYNPELLANERFVDEFVEKEEKKTSHEFHDIVMNYYRSRKSLLSVEEDLKLLRQNYDRIQAELWIIHKRNAPVEGQCADQSRVSKVHTYEQCELNQDAVSNMAGTLLSIRSEMQGDLALFAYSSQMSRLQVESYLHQLFMGCPYIRDMPKTAPVIAMDHSREELAPEVHKLRECISVLFGFHRRPTKDGEFVGNIRKWTERLVAALLRVASYADHLFLLNHVLRAPAGVGQWACSFVQIPGPASLALQTTLGSPVLDHAVACLATVLLPIKAREKFMCHMRLNVSENSLQMEQAWTLVDSDGEEDEDPSQAWVYLHENDVVAILQQIPLDAIFAHLLQAPVDENGTIHYDVSRCREPTILKLFAFCTVWISLLGEGLDTYSMARYRQLNKRLGRLIRQTIAFVSDHWLNFKTYYGPLSHASSLDRLQLEFDQLFMRATYTILTAQKLGSWQFMADMPFTCLSAGSIWRLLWLLQQGQGQPIDLHTLPPVEKCKEDMKDIESRRQLADALQNLPASESIYLLTTFANMASARPLEEDEFIECITLQVFEIAFICDHTRDFCSKTGRDLLSSIIQKHPTALSMLLRRVQGVVVELGKMAIYLFSELPASIWIPKDPDMLLLRQWLLNNDLNTAENQLACVVLDHMNWDLFAETGKLVLDIRLHRQVALLLVEAYMKYIADRRASFFIIEGMKQISAYAYSSQTSREQQFNNWAWSIALRLKLHRESAILHSRAAESQPFQAPSLEEEQWLLPLASAARGKNPIACFLVLTMTDVGHDVNQFMSVGLDMLMTLASSSQFSAVIHVLSCVTPQFLTTPQYLLENETFQKVLQIVLAADESVLKVTKMAMGVEFKAGTITQQLAQMIQAMISARLENNQALPTLLFWVQAIFKVAHFLTDQNCCFVLDHLVCWGYLQKGARDKLDAVFVQYFKQLQTESKSKGGFLTWVGGGPSAALSLMERGSMPEFGWLATQILNMEDTNDQAAGVWPSLQHELLSNASVSVEGALKVVLSRLKPEYSRTAARLSIYRWAQQALDMPVDHPMMPVVWQRFFSLYLGRCSQQAQMPARASVGERFFQTMSMSSMLKRMKKKLGELTEFHLKYDPQANTDKKDRKDSPSRHPSNSSRGSESESPLPSPVSEESPQYFSSKDFHTQLAKLYQTLALWLEEPRLHGADLYLPALPPQYEAARLLHVFTPGNSPWLEFVDFEGAQYQISLFAAQWRKLVSGRPQFTSNSPVHRRNAQLRAERTATERIKQRLQHYKNPQPPPALQTVSPPVPDIAPSLLTDKMAAIHLLDADLSVLTEFTKFFSTRAAQHMAIDAAFLDLLPGQYKNVPKQVKVTVECRSRVNPLHRCSGPAVVSVRLEEREVNSVVQRKMDENRAEYKQLMIEAVLPPPQNICIAAVHVENAITLLIKLSQSTSDAGRRSRLNDVACTLFFHLTIQVSEDTNFYPPTKQFFASCVEILGQEFVSRSPSQTPLLMQFSLDNPTLAGMVAPHFTPNNSPQNFVTMYEQLIGVLQQQNLNLVFMLLTKFDVRAWLEEIQPSTAEKKRFLEILGSALMSCGAEPKNDTKLVFDLYLGHLRCILSHQFPSNLSSVLSLLLQGSSSDELHTSCWEMLLMECCSQAPGSDVQAAAHRTFNPQLIQDCNSTLLSTEQLEELLRWLGAFFTRQRHTELELLSFGLYPRWGRYVPYLSLLLGLLSRSFIAKVLVNLTDHNPFPVLHAVWIQQLTLWCAWMEPMTPPAPPSGAAQIAGVDGVMQPWTEADSTVAVTMVETFKSTLLFLRDTLASIAPQLSSCVFSFLLMHYMTKLSHRSTPTHVSDVLVGEFCQLPWEQLTPDLQLLETMAALREHCASPCFHLIGYVMPEVRWADVIAECKAHQDPQLARRLQAAVLLLLVQCYGDIFVRELPKVSQLLATADMLDWSGLTVDAYRTASYWFLQVCQPQWVLAQRSSLPALGFRLMKAAAEFTPGMGQVWTGEMSVKRLTYVHCVTQQLCQVTFQPDVDLEATSTVLVNLLSEIESVESAVSDMRSQEEESLDLMKEVLGLLNKSNPEGTSQTVLLETLCQWLHSSPHSILLTPCIKAASRCLASLSQMVRVIETCIQVYFTAYTQDKEGGVPSPDKRSGWEHILAVFQVPELNVDQYVEEALKNGAFLLLYALLLHRRPLCQSVQEEAKLLEEVLLWTSRAAPSAEDEAKLLLWWMEFCEMWLRQLDFGAPVPQYVNAAQRLVVLLHQLGEDRASNGFLGVIGLGKRSSLSLQFRLAVRSLAAFLSSQILNETTLRFQSTSPLSDLPMAKQCRAALTSLRGNKMYASVKESVESMIGFIHRTDHTARHVVDLIKELALTLYPQCDYLTSSVK
ncbi:ectopic P granules protein 5 homolog [Littorina saxatilis]